MAKANKILKIVTISAIALASLTMIVLAIVNLVRNKGGVSETIAFRAIASALLIISSILSTCLIVAKDPHHFDARLVVFNGLLLGTGIFVVLDQAAKVADIVVGWFIPCLLIGLGAYFIVATVISLVNKINKRNTDIIAMILGVVMLLTGILFLAFAESVVKVMWLIIGVILLVYSILALITAIKSDKVKTIDTTTSNDNTDTSNNN